MPVTAEIGVSINFKALFFVGIKRDYLHSRGLRVLHKVGYCVAVGRYRVLREAGEFMRRVGDIWPGALIQEFEILHN